MLEPPRVGGWDVAAAQSKRVVLLWVWEGGDGLGDGMPSPGAQSLQEVVVVAVVVVASFAVDRS